MVGVLAGMDDAIPISNQEVEDGDVQFHEILGPAGSTTCKYVRVSDLGCGSFGRALLVRRVSDGLLLVAKRMMLSAMSEKDKKYAAAEIQCLGACDHFAIIKYHEDFVREPFMLIVMEFANAGDLDMQIKKRVKDGYNYFEEHEIGYTFVQLAMAVDHIHRRRMLHRDIKGANVLLMTNGIIKLGDFGFSHQYEHTVSDQVAQTFCGTPYYLAPELWNHQRYSKKADVWAMGIVLFELMALRRPFVGQGLRVLSEAVMQNQRDCDLPSHYSQELKELCNIMLQTNPNKRPSCAQLFKLPQMIKLLDDFEVSVDHSPMVSEELKRQIHENMREIRQTNANDPEAFTFVGPVGAVSTAVTYEGYVRKEGNQVWKERFLALRDGGLVISRQKGDKETKPLPVSFIHSVMFVPEQTACSPGVFVIILADANTMWFQALPPETVQMWVHKIQQAIGVS